MNYVIGVIASLLVAAFARYVGLDRDRAFYPTVLIVIASYYLLFAVMAGSTRALILESVVMAVFAAFAVAGFKRSMWLTVAGLFAHGVMDFFHGHLVDNPGVPGWWPGWCLAYDVGAAAALAWIIRAGAPRALDSASFEAR
jgi:hypothetical protein